MGVQECHGKEEVGVFVHFSAIQPLRGKANTVDYVESSPAGPGCKGMIFVLTAAEDA